MTNNENKPTKSPRISIGEQESEWYSNQLKNEQRYSMFLHNDASNATESKAFLNNTEFWFED